MRKGSNKAETNITIISIHIPTVPLATVANMSIEQGSSLDFFKRYCMVLIY